ncbi:hypothetical protein EE612_053290 [Oryza sativa]|nr:hypothetical protein EE612_053290 [Oryza sativa]
MYARLPRKKRKSTKKHKSYQERSGDHIENGKLSPSCTPSSKFILPPAL